ncbi:MAG TPA: response regulator [Dongiaceae bacterium]|jgi:two-component system chemotaxis response regulator CheY|nr:response regulator [Dongiaceae bacterium]
MTVIPTNSELQIASPTARSSARHGIVSDEDIYAQAALNVLVIDDQRTVRRIVRQLLSDLHVRHVYEAEDGQGGLDVMTAPDAPWIDMVICDLMMEGMDGLGFCNKLRSDPALRNRHIPVLILTAEHNELILNVVRQVGAADIAHKPISAIQLKDRLERLVGIRFT